MFDSRPTCDRGSPGEAYYSGLQPRHLSGESLVPLTQKSETPTLKAESLPVYWWQEIISLYQKARAAYQRGQQLQAILRPFVSQAVWADAVEAVQQGQRSLPTRQRAVSALRLDIVGFTRLMDSHPLDLMLPALNRYFDDLTQIVHRYGGEVDKYLGDGFLAVFESADDAVRAGQAIQESVAGFNQRQTRTDGFGFPTRLGIDSGQVMVVSLGSQTRQDRTLMGMPINIADRLQSKATPGRVWLTQATFDQLQDANGCRCLGPMNIRGQQTPVVIHEI